jgi:prepilin peptidase CpaA
VSPIGRIEPEFITGALVFFSIFAATTDLLRGKIYNSFILVMLLSGLVTGFINGGSAALLQGAGGVGAGLLLFGWMFALGFMGGGDVKFLMALGAWGGAVYAFETAVLSVLLGGLLAFFHLFFKGRLRAFWRRIQYSLLTLVTRELEFEAPELDRKSTLPFGVPMAMAASWLALHPRWLVELFSIRGLP